MRKFIISSIVSVLSVLGLQAQEITGRVVDEKNLPMEYAKVVLANRKDSAFVKGTVTDEKGMFHLSLNAKEADSFLLKVSAIGYRVQWQELPLKENVRLQPSAISLGGVEVRGTRRLVRSNARGLTVDMAHNPLSNMGSAYDALSQMPLIDASSGSIKVMGKGNPVFYINNREVRDESEIKQLSPSEIRSVEIVTKPGVRYASGVSSVIIIHTKKRNEGMAGTVTASGTAAEVLSGNVNADFSYAWHNGLGIFAGADYDNNGFKQNRRQRETFGDGLFHTQTNGTYRSRGTSLRFFTGASKDFSADNSMGVRYEFKRTPYLNYKASSLSTTNVNEEEETFSSLNHNHNQSWRHSLNAYALFKFGKKKNYELTVDADYIKGEEGNRQHTEENGIQSDRNIETLNLTDYQLAAAKGNLEMSWGKLSMELGGQFSYTQNKIEFQGEDSHPNNLLAPSINEEKQHLYAGYAELNYTLCKYLSVNGGIRVEHTDFDYTQDGKKVDGQSGAFTDWFPKVGLSFQKGAWNASLSYQTNIARPSYSSLNNNYFYVSPTSWSTGNPFLQPSLDKDLELSLSWKQTFFSATYSRKERGMNTAYFYRKADKVNVSQNVNLPDYNLFSFVFSQGLNVGFWHPRIQAMLSAQTLRYGTPVKSYRKPLGMLSMSNRFDLPWKMYAYVGGSWITRGNQGTLLWKGASTFHISLNKAFGAWNLTLMANDFLNTYRQPVLQNTNGVQFSNYVKGASHFVQLSVTYKLRQKKTYKGKGAAGAELERL